MSDALAFPESPNPVLAEVVLAAPATEKVPPRSPHPRVWLESVATASGALLAIGVIFLTIR